MYNVSQEYIAQVHSPEQSYRIQGTIGDVPITDDNILEGSLSITNRCTETDVGLGSVYMGEMRVTFLSNTNIDRFSWKGKVINISVGLLVDGDYEYVPFQPFVISSAKHTAVGTVVKAYDYMNKFDRGLGLNEISGTPYELLLFACEHCDVDFNMTEGEVEALPNGDATLSMSTETALDTYRDLIYWVAVTLAGFATIARDGSLVIRTWSSTSLDTYTADARMSGAEYDEYITSYTGIYLVYGTTAEYYGAEEHDTGLAISIGSNPFMQSSDENVRATLAGNIVNGILNIQYMPCKFSVAVGMHLDLGDVITISGGMVDDAITICVMSFNFAYKKSYTIESYGEDPAAKAQSKTDKNIAGLIADAAAHAWYMKTFTNARDIDVADGKSMLISNLSIAVTNSTTLLYLAEILATVTLSEGSESADVIVTYSLGGVEIIGYNPKQIYHLDGNHVIHLMYPVPVSEGTQARWIARITINGGSLHIDAGHIQASISGSGIAGEIPWDGTITLDDSVAAIPLHDITVASNLRESVIVAVQVPTPIVLGETISSIPLQNITVDTNLTESIIFNQVLVQAVITTNSTTTYDEDYVTIESDKWELITEYTTQSVTQQIDSGYCTKVTPYITGLTVSEVTIR